MQKLLGLIKCSLCVEENTSTVWTCQAVCDIHGRFLEMSIICGGLSSDLVAFEGSALKKCLDVGVLAPDLCLFGDKNTSIHILWWLHKRQLQLFSLPIENKDWVWFWNVCAEVGYSEDVNTFQYFCAKDRLLGFITSKTS